MRVLFAGLLVVLAAGCGGGDGDDRLSADELASQANAICAEYERKVVALGNPATLPELAEYARSARSALSEGLSGLGELQPPEDLESLYSSWVEAGERQLGRIDDLQQAAAGNDQARIEELLATAERADDETDQMASELGLKECADD